MRRRVVVGKAFDLKAKVALETRAAKADGSRRKYRPAVGREWDLEATADRRRVDLIDALTRTGLVGIVCLAGLSALAVAAVIGVPKGEYAPLAAVWAVLGPIYGGIAIYYFAPKRRR